MLKGFAIICLLLSILLITDSCLDKTYTKFELKGSSTDKVGIIKGGYVVNATFHWAYLNDNKDFAIHMYKGEFKQIEKQGYLELGTSPIFKVPAKFKVKRDSGTVEAIELQKQHTYTIFLPIFLCIISLLWLFAKPEKNMQWVMYGYVNMILAPIFFIFIILKVIDFLTHIGLYEILISGLEIPS